ncbi:MAG: hypothetical protein ACLQBD_01185 [Syntrophobacteraceae bacterium]
MKDWTWKGCLEVLQALSLIVGLLFIYCQVRNQSEALQLQNKILQDNQKINSATFVLKIDDILYDKRYEKIMSAIEDNRGDYKLLNGKFKERLLDEYISIFELLGNLVQDNVITNEMAYNDLGYSLEKAWCNHDVQKYIADARKADKNISGSNAFYIGFEKMAKYGLFRDGKTCSDMDEE